MAKYSYKQLKEILNDVKIELIQNRQNYIDFLKTVGNNFNYPYVHQLSIYKTNKNATACAYYGYWKEKGRNVKRGEEGIPILNRNREKISYIFDISQTKVLNDKGMRIKLWKYEEEKHKKVLDNILNHMGIKSGHLSQTEKIDEITRNYAQRELENVQNKLSEDLLKKTNRLNILKFIQSSLKISMCSRMNIECTVDFDSLNLIQEISGTKDIDILGNSISIQNKEIVKNVANEINIVNYMQREQEKQAKKGGMENAESNISGQGIYGGRRSVYSDRKKESIREERGNVFDNDDGGRRGGIDRKYRDAGDGGRNEADKNWKGKVELSEKDNELGFSDDVNRRYFDGAFASDRGTGGGIYSEGKTENDGRLADSGQKRSKVQEDDVSLKEKSYSTNSLRGVSFKKEQNTEREKEAEKASFSLPEKNSGQIKLTIPLTQIESKVEIEEQKEPKEPSYYSKDDPYNLMTDEMLEKVPKLYAQEDVALADKQVHAAYIIPFRSNWTWYMTEYDRESKDAFGLVLGIEPEWGYFNINELKELNAQRLVLEDFPKTFRELKDSELKKQMDEQELHHVFNGELSFEENNTELEAPEEAEESIKAESFQATLSDYLKERKELELNEKEESLSDEFAVKEGDTVYFNHEEYTVRETSDEIEIKKNQARNFKITEETLHQKLSPSERLNNNIEAISMLNRVESGERELDITAQEVLAKYVGWGGLSDVFDETKEGQWEKARTFLKGNLSLDEYEAAKESTLTAFYTPKVVIDGIYKTLSDMGFKGGNVLEPSCGVGNFIGYMPDFLSNNSKINGVELDSLSGRIAKLLYPNSKIYIKGFEETSFSNNLFDVAIGNVPFGEYKVNDREYNKNNFLIHDYFFAKSIDKVRNGGVIAFITSSGTMDKKDESIRKYINARAEFLGAIRLPNNTFKGVAGTEVTSDIIFLQKRDKAFERDDIWLHLETDKGGLTYNKYFVDNPQMILGDMKKIPGRFGSIIACLPKENADLKDLVNTAVKEISKNANYYEIEIDEIDNELKDSLPVLYDDEVENFSYTVIDGEVYYRENEHYIKKCLFGMKKIPGETEEEKDITVLIRKYPNKSEIKKIKDYIKVREAVKKVIQAQKNDLDDEEIKSAQKELNDVYDKLYKKGNFINGQKNTSLCKQDSKFYLVASIENIDDNGKFVSKGDIFSKRTIKKAKAVKYVETSLEALVLSVSEKGYVDFDYMKSLTGKNRLNLIEELDKEIFIDTDAINENDISLDGYSYVTKDEYLSGNIRKKIDRLDMHIERLKQSEDMSDDMESKKEISNIINKLNVQKDELIKAVPKELDASEISVRLGAIWIPHKDIERFIFETLKTPGYARWDIKVNFSEFTSKWQIDGKSVDKNNELAHMTYGTSRINAYELIESALNLKEAEVFDIVYDGEKEQKILNKKETILARQKQELIKEEFKNWIFNDQERRSRLAKLYNERFNSIRNREYNGFNLALNGISPEIKLKEHQKNAIARVLYGGNTLLAHVVGAGKTFEMVASAMESKRLGLCSKSLIVVPNHITGQFGREFMQLYPTANIMVADKKDFEPKKRKLFISRIATGEYDAVIIGHTQFSKIPMSVEYQKSHIKEEIELILNAIKEYKEDKGLSFTVKEMQNTVKKLETKLEYLNEKTKKDDDIITFEELGVDRLFIDEAHNYKNLHLYTKMRNVAGINKSESGKAADMFMKCRYMDEMTDGKGVIFATGTPISNSMTELYTMQRYLQYDALKEHNLSNFDAWASTYGETNSSFELSPEGTGYNLKTRFSKFYNLPELMSMFKEIADIQTADMLNLPTPEAHYEVIKTLPSEEQKEILSSLSERADKVRNRTVEPEEDNMLKITNDGKKLALDQRLINPLLPDNPNSKVNTCIKNIFTIWDKYKEKRLTQLVFCDMSTPKPKPKKKENEIDESEEYDTMQEAEETQEEEKFTVYDDVKDKLVGMGVPEEEIAFIHHFKSDEAKEKLFAKVRTGEIRILMGSTQKMGAGTNVQNKLIALHDLDVPWRPADLEQRAGRIVRQGNENKEVFVYRYVTENTFDSYLWQTIENKQKFISQIMTGKIPIRAAEGIDEDTLNYAEIKALATGDMRIKEKMTLDTEVTKLKMLEANYKSNRYRLEDKVFKIYPEEIAKIEKQIEHTKKDIAAAQLKGENKFTSITINGQEILEKKIAGEKLLEAIKKCSVGDYTVIGNYRGFEIRVNYLFSKNTYGFSLKRAGKHYGEFGNSADGNIVRLDNVIDRLPEHLKRLEENINNTKKQLDNAKAELEKPFDKADELKSKVLRLAELNAILGMGDDISDEYKNKNAKEDKLIEVKKAIIDFCNRECGNNYLYEDFDKLYPDIRHVDVATIMTPNEEHEITYELNLETGSWSQYVGINLISTNEFYGESIDDKLKTIREVLEASKCKELLDVDSEALYEKLGLRMGDDLNFYYDDLGYEYALGDAYCSMVSENNLEL